MNRQDAIRLDRELRKMLKNNEFNVNWMMDSGKVVMKRDGRVALSYSERDSLESAKEIKVLLYDYLTRTKKLKNVSIKLTNMLETYRPEVRITATIGKALVG